MKTDEELLDITPEQVRAVRTSELVVVVGLAAWRIADITKQGGPEGIEGRAKELIAANRALGAPTDGLEEQLAGVRTDAQETLTHASRLVEICGGELDRRVPVPPEGCEDEVLDVWQWIAEQRPNSKGG
jgi:hypothetical protein